MSKGKQGKAQSYRVDRSVLQRLLAYNIGYALLEKATAITLGATYPELSTRNSRSARGMVISELPSWRMEQILASLWENLGSGYSVDDIDLATRKYSGFSAGAVLDLLAGKVYNLGRYQVLPGTAIYEAKTLIAFLGPLYKDKFSGMLRTVSDWARDTGSFSRGFESLPCEEFTNGVLVSWPSLFRDRGLLPAKRPTEWPSEVLDDLEDLTRRAEKWEAQWKERIKEEAEYEKSIEKAAWNDRYERVTEENEKNRALRKLGIDPAGVAPAELNEWIDVRSASEVMDAMSYMLPGTKVSLPKDFPKGFEPPSLPENGSLTWPKVLGMTSGNLQLRDAFGGIYDASTTARSASDGFGTLSEAQIKEVMRRQQERLNAALSQQADLLTSGKMSFERTMSRQQVAEFMGIPVVVEPAMKPGTVGLRSKGKSAPKAEPEPEPISPFDSKPRQFSFEEE
jgi:hypothetical protein